MYKVIGSDGNQYGPISADQVRQWYQEGRLTPETKIQAEGGAWQPLLTCAAFGDLFSKPALPSAPVPTAQPVSGGTGQPAKTSGMAIASLVLGVVTIFCSLFTALPAIILGFISMGKIRRSNGALKGRGLAITGIAVAVVMLFAHAGLLIGGLGTIRGGVHAGLCSVKVVTLSQACASYARDHDNTLPSTLDDLKAYLPKEEMDFAVCPANKNSSEPSYEIVGAGQSVSMNDAANIMVIRETEKRHMGSGLVGYLDGHVEHVR